MNLQPASPSTTGLDERPDGVRTRLHGLLLARVLWIAIFILTLLVFCGTLLVGNYGLARTILLVAVTSVWFTVSLVLFWRKSTDRTILLFSLVLVLGGGGFPHLAFTSGTYGVWWLPIDVLAALAGVMLSFVYTFPDGRFVPGLTRWLALGWITASLVPVPILGISHPWNWCALLFIAALLSLCCTAIGGCPHQSNASRSSGWSSEDPSSLER